MDKQKKQKIIPHLIALTEESIEFESLEEFVGMYERVWGKLKKVIIILESWKITRQRMDRKLSAILTKGEAITAYLNHPEHLENNKERFLNILDRIEEIGEKTHRILKIIDFLTKEDSAFGDIINTVRNFLDQLDTGIEKLEDFIDDKFD